MKKASREIIEITLAIIGVVVGISACALFAAKYHNYSAGVWAAISAAFALFFLYIVLSVRRDVQHQITLVHFLVYTVIGGIGIVAGLAVFIAYLVIGLKDNEKVDARGSYVVVIWGFMTFKWSLFLLMSARSYRKDYMLIEGSTTIVNT